MAAKRVVEKLEKTIETQNHIIDDLVKENYELKQLLNNDTTHRIQTQYVERFTRIPTAS
jgi:cell division protein FtsB